LGKSGTGSAVDTVDSGAKARTRSADRSGTGGLGVSAREKKARSVEDIYQRPGQSNRIQGLLDFYSNLSADQFSTEAEKLEALPFNERILASVLLFGKWAEVDPTAAMSFTDTMPIWASADNNAAVGFIKAQTSPAVKDSAAESYIWSNRSSKPAELVEVAGMITNEGSRNRATGIVAARWMQENKAAATDFINDDMKQRLLSGRPMWGGDRRGRGRD
jgi:hypothetical protein